MKKKENASFDSEILQLDSVDTADTTQLPIEHLIGFVKKRIQLGVTEQGRGLKISRNSLIKHIFAELRYLPRRYVVMGGAHGNCVLSL